jgi:REP-associated tyrosine transposase
MREHIGREHPASGVYIFRGQATIAFLTVCAWKRERRLANPRVHEALIGAWRASDAWFVGHYVIMPDHVHLFCAPNNEDYTIEQWITFWKRQFKRVLRSAAPRFQSHGFHHRLRRSENYAEKWDYVRANLVRAGLVSNPDNWPFQGVLTELKW